jgi:hypothetical protein
MFQITRTGNRLDIDLQGKLDRGQMAAALEEFEVKSAGIEHGVMRYRMIRHFDRAAILADESWLRRFSEWEGKLIPGFEIKAFPLADEAAAEHWLRPPVLM